MTLTGISVISTGSHELPYLSRARALFAEYKPLLVEEKQEKGELRRLKNEFQLLRLSPVQWKQAHLLAVQPAEDLDEIFGLMAQWTGQKKETFELRRQVGITFPNPHPLVCFGVYAELIKAKPEDRDAIFAGHPTPVKPEEWTIDAMRGAVRSYYGAKDPSEGVQKKSLSFDGYGPIVIRYSQVGLEITVPSVAGGVETVRNFDTTLLKVAFQPDA
jgi:hypothetical protein